MKYLLLFAFLATVWWVWSKRQAARDQEGAPQREMPAEKMVSCAHCRVHLPESEGIAENGQVYCCDAHRLAGPAAGR